VLSFDTAAAPSGNQHQEDRMAHAKSAHAKSGMGRGKTEAHQGETRTERAITDESELGSDIQGRNKLQGDDQKNVRNERRTMPDE
jgi:hypothetical protein